ncbi:MAG: hypothetical protein A2504_01465 [Bdellovibrionales bacterium RIFOXYD12_FULL_39_22]|nr:MAG: hypothetical protein A2385_02355 [Bdellovibrionales bacterium RIFOXYB1_FULL_39_21]OFZ42775.1 MAG: hypothetical protein A2485_10540 [Bdellovibrionales bacterium RIFOXYC12_FULL_39_17]OFZ47334.1 MAG: hypothetical protein A2404_15145 [Bdellovibrionales bacterium RIFOXYC1_FULL_39_130]OFZ73210.1 MAG: hypothetical protein A2451_16730 [Bdellovibrionales bacterium RIFOXYC2_FULL_39_8]OFZ75500.1 MAG: hypothetical protein A2560_04415 [Bdellovibrionales bacterium RIFOXYD1_FULL_39_84]OFZ93454.1 MAG:
MKLRLISLLAMIVLLLVPSYAKNEERGTGSGQGQRQGQRAEHKKEQRERKEQRRLQRNEMQANKFAEHRNRLQERLAQNSKLTDAEREEILAAFDTNHTNRLAHRNAQYEESLAFYDKLAGDSNMTPEQRRTAIAEFKKKQIAENKQFQGEQHSKMIEMKKSVKGNTSDDKAASTTATEEEEKATTTPTTP